MLNGESLGLDESATEKGTDINIGYRRDSMTLNR
jgi:hypothetical protein